MMSQVQNQQKQLKGKQLTKFKQYLENKNQIYEKSYEIAIRNNQKIYKNKNGARIETKCCEITKK